MGNVGIAPMNMDEALKGTFSFIGPLESETIVEPYGNNALSPSAVPPYVESKSWPPSLPTATMTGKRN